MYKFRNVFEGYIKIMRSLSHLYSTRSNISVKDFNPKKILILKKLTRYEFNKISHRDMSEKLLKKYLRSTGSDYDGLLERHTEHYKKVDQLLLSLSHRKEVEVRVVDRFDYTAEQIAWADLVVTAGGDGTFLMGASRIPDGGKPILGVNTDVRSSEGYLCIPRRLCGPDVGVAVDLLFAGRFDWLWRQRISVRMGGTTVNDQNSALTPLELHEMQLSSPEFRFVEHVREAEDTMLSDDNYGSGVGGDSTHIVGVSDGSPGSQKPLVALPYKALNEVFVGESLSARVSYYELSVDGANSQKQKSSGVTVSTGTGSSSWSFHISHVAEDSARLLLQLAADELDQHGHPQHTTPSLAAQLTEPGLVRSVCSRYNSSLCFSPEEPRMAYTVRDPIKNKIFHVAHPRGFANKMTMKSRMWDAHIVIDGGVSYRFNDGAVALLEIDPRFALRCVSLRSSPR